MTRDWEPGTLSYRHFERQREIFVIRGLAYDVRKLKTCYPLTFGHRPLYIRGEAATLTR